MTKRSWERGFGVRDADVAVWGADMGGRGWEGGFLSVFWAGGGEGSEGVLFLGQSGAHLCGFLPSVFTLGIRGLCP